MACCTFLSWALDTTILQYNGVLLNIYATHGLHTPRGQLWCYWGRNHLNYTMWRVAGCTDTAFQVVKLSDFTSFANTELIIWEKVKEVLLCFASSLSSTNLLCLMQYEVVFISLGSNNHRRFCVNVQGSPRAPSRGALHTEASTFAELTNIVLLLDGLALPLHPVKPKQVAVRAKNFAKHGRQGLDWCPVQDIYRKFGLRGHYACSTIGTYHCLLEAKH